MNRADLHAHTTASDGTFKPAELTAEAKRIRLEVLAVTDHDSTEGIAPAVAANDDPILRIIPGIEINCDIPDGEVHVLGYFNQLPGGALQALFQTLRDARIERGRGMTEKMTALGHACSFARVQEFAAGGSVGRPHVARAIVEAGYAATIGEAFERYIGRNGPAYVERMQFSPAEAVRAIRESGGVPVLAHPYAFDQYGTILKSVDPENSCRSWWMPGCAALKLTTIAIRLARLRSCSNLARNTTCLLPAAATSMARRNRIRVWEAYLCRGRPLPPLLGD